MDEAHSPHRPVAPAPARDGPDDTRDAPGRVLAEVLGLALPTVLTAASMTIMRFVDVTFVSWLGKPQLAAVSNAGVVVFALFALAGGIASCVSTFASQSLGRGRPRDSSAYAWQNAFFAIVVGLAALPLVPLAPRFFAWLGHAPAVQAHMTDYAQVRLCGLGLGVCSWGFCAYFQGIQRPGVALASTIVANVFNLVADCVLIFGLWGFPALGIRGAALATVLALALQCLLLIAVAVRAPFARTFGGWDTCRLDWVKLRRLLRIGWPVGLTLSLDITSWAIFNHALIGHFGTDALAGNTAAVQYMHVAFMLTLGLGHATTALVGKYVGMGDLRRARQRTCVALGVALAYMLAMAVLFLALRYPLARHFSHDPAVVAIAAQILIFAAVFQAFRALEIISGGALRGAGDTRWTAVVSVACNWLLFLPLGFLLVRLAPHLSTAGPWLAATVYITCLGVILFWRFLSQRWATIDIFRTMGRAEQ